MPSSSHVTRAFVTVDVDESRPLQLHYRVCGDGPRTAIVLAQCPGSSSEWVPTLPALAEHGLRVIALDLPGLGDSDAFERAPTMADYAMATARALLAIGLDEPVDFVGHHSGAAVALALAWQFPERARRLVFAGLPVWPGWEDRYRKVLSRAAPNDWDTTGEAVGGGWGRTAAGMIASGADPTLVPDYTRRVWISRLQAGALWFRPYVAVGTWEDSVTAMRTVPHDTLIIATVGDGLAELAEWQAGAMRRCRVAPLASGGSFPHLANQQGFVATVAPFLTAP